MPSGEKTKSRYEGFSGKIWVFSKYFFQFNDFLFGSDLFYVISGDKNDSLEKIDKNSK